MATDQTPHPCLTHQELDCNGGCSWVLSMIDSALLDVILVAKWPYLDGLDNSE